MSNWDYNPYKGSYIITYNCLQKNMLFYDCIWQSRIPRWTETLGLSEPLGIVKGSSKVAAKTSKPIQKTGESSWDWTLCLLVVLVLGVFLSLIHDMKTLALSLEVEGESWTVCEGICWGPPCRFQKRGSSMSFSRLSPRQDERNERNANRECQAHPAPGCWDYLKGVSWWCCC